MQERLQEGVSCHTNMLQIGAEGDARPRAGSMRVDLPSVRSIVKCEASTSTSLSRPGSAGVRDRSTVRDVQTDRLIVGLLVVDRFQLEDSLVSDVHIRDWKRPWTAKADASCRPRIPNLQQRFAEGPEVIPTRSPSLVS